MRAPVSTAIAIAVGVIVLLGYFLPIPLLIPLRELFISWAVILAGVAGLVAILNMLSIHWRKINNDRNRDYFSIFLLLAFVFTLIAGFILQPSDPGFQKIVTHIQVPIEASLMGVLTVSLTYASIRMFRRRTGWMAIIFTASAVVFLIVASGFLTIGNDLPLIKDLLAALNTLPVAGARGILLGIALGSLTTGLRILMGADRPYSG
jgi:hypothetical protein